MTTHYEGCWDSGPRHYECALLEVKKRLRREWVSLTDEDIKDIVGRNDSGSIGAYTRKLFKQIEDKLREKNGG
jgi:hypothetical protein